MIEENPYVTQALLEVVNNQLRANDPPETRQALDRLIAEGISEDQARRHIACAVFLEMQDTMRTMEPFDLQRYIRYLDSLPFDPDAPDE